MSASVKFNKVFTKKFLKQLYYESVGYRNARGHDNVSNKSFRKTLNENVDVIYRKVRQGTYRFTQYKEKLISKGPEKYPRVISIPSIRDKLTQRALCEILNDLYGTEFSSLRNIVDEVIKTYESNSYSYFIRFDVKDFYPSIVHEILLKTLSKKIKKTEVLNLIKSAISQNTVAKPIKRKPANKKGVPQGLSISNILANIYMMPLDIKHGNNSSYKYFRYVDDIMIFCNKTELESIQQIFTTDTEKLGLKLHPAGEADSKTIIGRTSDTFTYLGYEFNSTKISVQKKSSDKLRNSIISIITSYKHSKTKNLDRLIWTLNLRITGSVFNGKPYGWVFYFRQIKDLSLLKQLDIFVHKQLIRFNIDSQNCIKTFVRTYYEITKRYSKTKYIPNFDRTSSGDKRVILNNIFDEKSELMTKEEVDNLFNMYIYRQLKDLERDLARPS